MTRWTKRNEWLRILNPNPAYYMILFCFFYSFEINNENSKYKAIWNQTSMKCRSNYFVFFPIFLRLCFKHMQLYSFVSMFFSNVTHFFMELQWWLGRGEWVKRNISTWKQFPRRKLDVAAIRTTRKQISICCLWWITWKYVNYFFFSSAGFYLIFLYIYTYYIHIYDNNVLNQK